VRQPRKRKGEGTREEKKRPLDAGKIVRGGGSHGKEIDPSLISGPTRPYEYRPRLSEIFKGYKGTKKELKERGGFGQRGEKDPEEVQYYEKGMNSLLKMKWGREPTNTKRESRGRKKDEIEKIAQRVVTRWKRPVLYPSAQPTGFLKAEKNEQNRSQRKGAHCEGEKKGHRGNLE